MSQRERQTERKKREDGTHTERDEETKTGERDKTMRERRGGI